MSDLAFKALKAYRGAVNGVRHDIEEAETYVLSRFTSRNIEADQPGTLEPVAVDAAPVEAAPIAVAPEPEPDPTASDVPTPNPVEASAPAVDEPAPVSEDASK